MSLRTGLIRLDVEDYLTPESDDALAVLVELLDRHRLPASLGFVGEKARALQRHGRHALLEHIASRFAVGFHSTSHSRHPTIGEELADLPYAAGVAAFLERERSGVEAVRDAVGAPGYFTQPGGNWVPQAVHALPHWGMRGYFSEEWNSYLTTRFVPYWWEGLLHLALPVPAPRPLLHGMPDNVEVALRMIQNAVLALPEGGMFCIVLHPTEMVTTEFWDAVNFGGGKTRDVLVPAPLRPVPERRRVVESLDRYLGALAALPQVVWRDFDSLWQTVAATKPEGGPVRTETVLKAWQDGIGWGKAGAGYFSAADAVGYLAERILDGAESGPMPDTVRAPLDWRVTPVAPGTGPLWSRSTVRAAAAELVEILQHHGGRLPNRVAGQDVAEAAGRFAAYLGSASDPIDTPVLRLAFLDEVKPTTALHWDWPIFPPGFQPRNLWEETRRLAWSLKPAL